MNDEEYVLMFISWLREIAMNNLDDKRLMTITDAAEEIKDRASTGLKNYFRDNRYE